MTESLLCLDPSSTACGVAYFPTADIKQNPMYMHVIRPTALWSALSRIDFIVAGVLETVRRLRPSIVVMEYSSGKVAGRLHGKDISGLAVMGQAQGEVRRALICLEKNNLSRDWKVETVSEEWTGRIPKSERAAVVSLMFPEYAEFARDIGDPGCDAADAVGIGQYWIGQRNIQEMIDRAK